MEDFHWFALLGAALAIVILDVAIVLYVSDKKQKKEREDFDKEDS